MNRAIGLMLLSMASFAVADLWLKLATQALPPGQVIVLMGLGGVAVFLVLCRRANLPLWSPAMRHSALLWRNGGEAVAAGSFIVALSLTSLSLASAIFQATPLVTTLLAAILLREKVGPWRWGAVLAGIGGMLLILRPWGADLGPGALWALAATIGMAVRDISTRFVPKEVHTLQLSTFGFAALLPAGGLVSVLLAPPVWPSALPLAQVALACGFCALAYWAITTSLRLGEISAVMPYRFSRILFALILAVLILGERPDGMTLLGAAVLVAAGLVIFWREGRRRSH